MLRMTLTCATRLNAIEPRFGEVRYAARSIALTQSLQEEVVAKIKCETRYKVW